MLHPAVEEYRHTEGVPFVGTVGVQGHRIVDRSVGATRQNRTASAQLGVRCRAV